jgi:hypothetical protein
MNATITQGPSSAFGEVKNGTPRAISKARKSVTKAKIATPMHTNPTNERSRRLRPRTISAPQPVQTLALSGTRAWQCGHARLFTPAQYHYPYQSTSGFLWATLLPRSEFQ